MRTTPPSLFSENQEHSLYTSIAVFLLGSIALIVTSGYSVGAALLLIGGLYTVITARPLSLSKQDWLVIGTLVFFGTVGVADAFFRGVSSSAYDKPIRFILACFALPLILRYPPRLSWLWTGLALGSLFAGTWAGYQKLFLSVARAEGHTHVIQFGNISMLMGFLCLAGIGWACAQPNRKRWVLLLAIGALSGIAGSVFSGSRGGWVGLPLVILVLYRSYHDFLSLRTKIIAALCIGVALAGVFNLPQTGVQQRVKAAFSDVEHYFNGNSNTSVGARFEMWKGAARLYAEKPIIGWGHHQYQDSMVKLVEQGKAHSVTGSFTHPHNEVLNSAAKYGTIGLLALLALYLVPIRLFASSLTARSLSKRSLATAGTLLAVSYIDFGLSQAFFTHNSGSMIYAFWLVVLWGCYRNQP